MRGLGLPPVWRWGLIFILIALMFSTAYWIIQTPSSPDPEPTFTPMQLPTVSGVR